MKNLAFLFTSLSLALISCTQISEVEPTLQQPVSSWLYGYDEYSQLCEPIRHHFYKEESTTIELNSNQVILDQVISYTSGGSIHESIEIEGQDFIDRQSAECEYMKLELRGTKLIITTPVIEMFASTEWEWYILMEIDGEKKYIGLTFFCNEYEEFCHLTPAQLEIPATGGTIEAKVEYQKYNSNHWFIIDQLFINDQEVTISKLDNKSQEFFKVDGYYTFEGQVSYKWLTIHRDCDTLTFTAEPNETGKERTIKIRTYQGIFGLNDYAWFIGRQRATDNNDSSLPQIHI